LDVRYKRLEQFLHIAQGSIFGVVTLNEIFRRTKLFENEDANEVRERYEQIDRKLNVLINSLQEKKVINSSP
jgi:four helix bundle protein